ncbi:polyamine oxidase [Verticillium alfalfae VaMs.102]|uniref:Polyamine oxidase n=1 Tax=Verticillium alfalfae (strain VaMs.102 / ATCC MYA-4576 / FGSC 10136) TaxID=526221 RepID=C9SA11_VERA1|nr:polyamine oxidase [Verticillium alfalfae VaMs.102]EEY16224.1 polyamine oxidase [Verticillium alfalfae VaMs.102]
MRAYQVVRGTLGCLGNLGISVGSKLVSLGANWIEGVGATGPVKNPILEATDKAKIKSVFSNYSALVSYDHQGANDYLHLLDEYDGNFTIATQDAASILENDLQDSSMRAGLSVAGWKPGRDMLAQASEWWSWDFGVSWSPDECGFQFGITGDNETFNRFGDERYLAIEERGLNAFVREEALTFLDGIEDPRLLLNTTVDAIEHSTKGVVVHDRNGGCVEAEYAICTFSVGVLQNDVVEFKPRLPVWKREAIEQFQMGTYTKIFMQFNESFWPEDAQFLLYADEDEPFRAEQQTDEETKAQILAVLRKMFPDANVPEPTAFMYPRWGQEDNWPVGMTLTKHQNLRANVGRLWFSGEANSAKYYGFMHGAYYEGKDAGERIAAMVKGEPIINQDTAPDGQLKRYEKLYGSVNMNEYNEGNGWPDDE